MIRTVFQGIVIALGVTVASNAFGEELSPRCKKVFQATKIRDCVMRDANCRAHNQEMRNKRLAAGCPARRTQE